VGNHVVYLLFHTQPKTVSTRPDQLIAETLSDMVTMYVHESSRSTIAFQIQISGTASKKYQVIPSISCILAA